MRARRDREGVGGGCLTGDQARAQECGRGVEIVVRDLERLALRAHAVPELQARVPDRVPDALGDGLDVPARAAQEHDVEVALGADLGSAVAADRDQSYSL